MSSGTRYNARDAFENIFREEGIQYPIENEIELVDLVRKGVTKTALIRVAEFGEFSMKELAGLLPISERTIHRYSDGERLSEDISERVLLLAEVLVRGCEVFGSREAMKEWVRSPVFVLGGRTPFSVMNTISGLQLASDILGRIQHGVYS